MHEIDRRGASWRAARTLFGDIARAFEVLAERQYEAPWQQRRACPCEPR